MIIAFGATTVGVGWAYGSCFIHRRGMEAWISTGPHLGMGFWRAGHKMASRRRLGPQVTHAVVRNVCRQGGGRGGLRKPGIWTGLEGPCEGGACHKWVLLCLHRFSNFSRQVMMWQMSPYSQEVASCRLQKISCTTAEQRGASAHLWEHTELQLTAQWCHASSACCPPPPPCGGAIKDTCQRSEPQAARIGCNLPVLFCTCCLALLKMV